MSNIAVLDRIINASGAQETPIGEFSSPYSALTSHIKRVLYEEYYFLSEEQPEISLEGIFSEGTASGEIEEMCSTYLYSSLSSELETGNRMTEYDVNRITSREISEIDRITRDIYNQANRGHRNFVIFSKKISKVQFITKDEEIEFI